MTSVTPGDFSPATPSQMQETRSRSAASADALDKPKRGARSAALSGQRSGEAQRDIQITPELKLRIRFDKASERFVYLAVNAESGEIERQYPPDQALRLIARMRAIAGLTLDRSL